MMQEEFCPFPQGHAAGAPAQCPGGAGGGRPSAADWRGGAAVLFMISVVPKIITQMRQMHHTVEQV
eukprot:CAMPEP_0170594508 /NCGR_PEP_ID=MMETSP0224-20130122/14040_1 /TAXON_ID=285029 /ORGANISM="Togula jolla, Strain CCCM 725" /LENGTH=65 /DNA_ID=CAMNT_0010918575 /DNA_START=150 /DNA_END=344 /DNA_ORIENTATION=+